MNRDKLEQELTRFEEEVLSGFERPRPPSQTFRPENNLPPPVPSYPYQSNMNPPPPPATSQSFRPNNTNIPPPPSLSHSFQPVTNPPPPPSLSHSFQPVTNPPLPPPRPQPAHSGPSLHTNTIGIHPPPSPYNANAFIRPTNSTTNSEPILRHPANTAPNNSIPAANNTNVQTRAYQPPFPAISPYRPPLIQQVVPRPFMAPQPIALPMQATPPTLPTYCLPNHQVPLIPTHVKPQLHFTPSSVQANLSKHDTTPGGKKTELAAASKDGPATVSAGVVCGKKKGLKHFDKKQKKLLRAAAGQVWFDDSMEEWDSEDYRIFCGDLGNEVNDEILYRAFSQFKSLQKVRVIRDKRSHKSKGYGFVSFKDPKDFLSALKEVNGKYIGNRPVKLRKSVWRERTFDVVRKKTIEKKKLGLR